MLRLALPVHSLVGIASIGLLASGAAADPLGGHWQRPCWTAELELQATEVMAFSEDSTTVSIQRDFTVQDTCNVPDFRLLAKAEVRLGGESAAVSGAREIDFLWTDVTLTPLHPEAATAFNDLFVCDFNDWEANVPKAVSGRTCQGLTPPRVGERFYQIYAVRDGLYHSGDYTMKPATDGSAPDRRPTQLSDQPHVRQEH